MTTTFPRIRRVVDGIGLVQITTGAKTAREHTARVALFDRLVADSQLRVIRALLAGEVSWGELRESDRDGELSGSDALGAVLLSRPCFASLLSVVPKLGRAETTRKRYRVSLAALAAQEIVPWPHDPMRVKDLKDVDWPRLAKGWPHSPGDWNNVGRTLRATLRKYAGKRAKIVGQVMDDWPFGPTVKRLTNLTPARFLLIRGKLPEYVRPCVDVLVLTGMRVRSEYLKCTRANLLPETHQVFVGQDVADRLKTDGSRALVSVAPAMWPLVDAGIPSPIKYKALRKHWNKAAKAAGMAGLTVHALRRAHGQWAADAGVPLTAIKSQLRHSTLQMTMDYATTGETSRVAEAVATAFQSAPRAD